jgi:hypothetical protein
VDVEIVETLDVDVTHLVTHVVANCILLAVILIFLIKEYERRDFYARK